MNGITRISSLILLAFALVNSGCRRDMIEHDMISAASAPPLAKARGGHAAGIVDGTVIIAGGTLWSDDRLTKTWLDDCNTYGGDNRLIIPPLPHPVAYCAYACDESGLYIAGGSDGKNTLNNTYRLTKQNDAYQWQSLSSLSTKLTFAAGAIIDKKFFVACGSDGTNALNTLYMLPLDKPDSGWKKCQSLPGNPRMLPAFTACRDKLYLFGGFSTEPDKPLTAYNDVYRYDPKKDKWEMLKDFPVVGYGWNAAPIDDRRILISGRADGKIIHKGIWIYDTITRSAFLTDKQIPIQTTTAPLIKTAAGQFLLLGGEPDALKTRTAAVTAITVLN